MLQATDKVNQLCSVVADVTKHKCIEVDMELKIKIEFDNSINV